MRNIYIEFVAGLRRYLLEIYPPPLKKISGYTCARIIIYVHIIYKYTCLNIIINTSILLLYCIERLVASGSWSSVREPMYSGHRRAKGCKHKADVHIIIIITNGEILCANQIHVIYFVYCVLWYITSRRRTKT